MKSPHQSSPRLALTRSFEVLRVNSEAYLAVMSLAEPSVSRWALKQVSATQLLVTAVEMAAPTLLESNDVGHTVADALPMWLKRLGLLDKPADGVNGDPVSVWPRINLDPEDGWRERCERVSRPLASVNLCT